MQLHFRYILIFFAGIFAAFALSCGFHRRADSPFAGILA